MSLLPALVGMLLLATALGSAVLLHFSGRGWRSVRISRRSRRNLTALRRLSELQATRLPDHRLMVPLRGDAAWRRLIRRGQRYRNQSNVAGRR